MNIYMLVVVSKSPIIDFSNVSSLHPNNYNKPREAPVAQWVKRWPTDLAVPSLSLLEPAQGLLYFDKLHKMKYIPLSKWKYFSFKNFQISRDVLLHG